MLYLVHKSRACRQNRLNSFFAKTSLLHSSLFLNIFIFIHILYECRYPMIMIVVRPENQAINVEITRPQL